MHAEVRIQARYVAARLAQAAGADGITMHLREDRRHIRDADVFAVKKELALPLNLEMAATDEMLEIAINVKPHACCIVPEKREELTTEGGLDVVGNIDKIWPYVSKLTKEDIRVSLFIDPDESQIHAAKQIGAPVIELHTGMYCNTTGAAQQKELQSITSAATLATELGIECHAGHGLAYDNVESIAAIPHIIELNIGHFLMGEAMFVGLEAAIKKMRQHMDAVRHA